MQQRGIDTMRRIDDFMEPELTH